MVGVIRPKSERWDMRNPHTNTMTDWKTSNRHPFDRSKHR